MPEEPIPDDDIGALCRSLDESRKLNVTLPNEKLIAATAELDRERLLRRMAGEQTRKAREETKVRRRRRRRRRKS